MQSSAAASAAFPCLVNLAQGLQLTVEVRAGEMVIRIVQAVIPTPPDAPSSVASTSPMVPAIEHGLEVPAAAARASETGRQVAERVAAERGDDALLKLEEWDAILPPRIVRRKLKSAMKEGVLPFSVKGSGRDGRAKLISAGAMVRYLADQELSR